MLSIGTLLNLKRSAHYRLCVAVLLLVSLIAACPKGEKAQHA
jgi:hypothetical protein